MNAGEQMQQRLPTMQEDSLFGDLDLYLIREGRHTRAYRQFGAHPVDKAGHGPGVQFAVWAPNARQVSVVGDFNDWNGSTAPLAARDDGSGIWEGFVRGVQPGARYKYRIEQHGGATVDKADPYAFASERPPADASRVTLSAFRWQDERWLETRAESNPLTSPTSIYEVHLGSWRRGDDDRFLTYREIAEQLADYVGEKGFTHVELLPVTEHPFYGSWGYQSTGYFSPTARYGSPDDLRFLIDYLHRHGIGVILDWVPSHFPNDRFAMGRFDGTCLYEHEDPRKGWHPDWKSLIFNYGRFEVMSFLLSSAHYWLDEFHADGLRVDGVASMLYLDYSRDEGQWIPNRNGGNENLEAIDFLKQLNESIFRDFPGVRMVAEESTSWPKVSKPVYDGGLGFGQKWNMGWMHDTLEYLKRDPVHRSYHHDSLTFSLSYAFSEHFVLSLSHDEIVHGKNSLIGKMPGDEWQQFANLRLLFGWMFGHPGKKLMFMGCEFGQWREWSHDRALDWHLLDEAPHRGLLEWITDLNALYTAEPSLYALDSSPAGFEWIDADNHEQSTLSFMRKSSDGEPIVVALNFTPVPRQDFRVGVPRAGSWQEILNGDHDRYHGSGLINAEPIEARDEPLQGQSASLAITLPPLGAVFLKPSVDS